MRILHVLDHSIPLHSGYSFRTLGILQEQRALGWETFHLTSPKQGECNELEEQVDGWHFYRCPAWGGIGSQAAGIREFDVMGEIAHRLDEVALQLKPHLLHVHSPVLNVLPALLVGRRRRIPVLYEVRAFWEDAAVNHGTSKEKGARYWLTRALETYALKRADAVTTICSGLRNDIVARGIPKSKVTVIPNAVDSQKFTIAAPNLFLKDSLGLSDCTVIGFIGSFYAYEGLAVLLEAFPMIIEEVPNARVVLVGGGVQEDALKKLAKDLGITNYVLFLGRVPHSKVSEYYDTIDVMVYPRLSMRLTELVTPLKPLEAMAQGRLVVASDVGGHRELIKHEETGILFRAGDPDELAKTLVNIINHREKWPNLKHAARQWVETERTWRVVVNLYKEIYISLSRRS